jgi:hypothetical protein
LGMSSSQLTKSYFSEGLGSTTKQIMNLTIINHIYHIITININHY